MTPIKGPLPIPEAGSKRSPEERNIRRLLGRVRRNLAKSTQATFKSSWESRVKTLEAQLATAGVRARFIK